MAVLQHGTTILDQRNQQTCEILHLNTQIKTPFFVEEEHDFWYGDRLDLYQQQFISADKGTFDYTYGNRFRGYWKVDDEPVDQLSAVIDRIREDRNTRRAIMVTFDPEKDHTQNEIPCLIGLSFLIRDVKESNLNIPRVFATGFWRSHDIYGAYLPNVFGVLRASEFIAKEIGAVPGPITTHSVSAHIYGTDLDAARQVK